ncbi:GSCOCT00013041001.2-RA-CDS, partial [Cotesia congregata]|uniref:Cc_ben.3_6.3b n=2 Tax=root TaxID=1 RepID=S6D9I4_COTCN
MTRKSDKPAFYVVQFLDLPYEGIDDYVCVPHTWVMVHKVHDMKAVVTYPTGEDPSLTRDRVKRKEKCDHEWKFFMAAVKYHSNSYQNAEAWTASRNDHRLLVERETRKMPDTQPESAPNLNSRNSTQGNSSKFNDNPRKPLPRTLITRPSLPELNEQLDGKRFKLKKAAKPSSDSVTDANTESIREQSTNIQDNRSTKLTQTQETAAASKINSRTEQRTQTQRTEQNKEALSLPVIDVDGPPEVMEIDDRHHSPGIKTSNQNNSTSHSHLSDTAAVPMSATKPLTSTERNTQPYQYNNQQHILDNRNSLSIFETQLENIRSLANAHNDHELRSHEVSSNTPTTSHKVMNSLKIPAQLCDNVYGTTDFVQARNAIDKKICRRKMNRNLEIVAQNSSNLMGQPGSLSARSVEEQSSVVAQTRSQDGPRVREMHPGNSTDQTAPLWQIIINSPEIQHTPKRNAESTSNTLLASQNLPSSSYIPSTGQILTKPSNPLYQTSKFPQQRPSQSNQQDSQRQPQIPDIRTSVSNELQKETQMPTLQEVKKKVQSSVLSNLLKSMQSTLSANHNEYLRSEKQARLSQQSTEHNNRELTSSPKNVVVSTTSDKHQHVIDNTRQTGECVVKPVSPHYAVTSDSDTVTDEGILDHELSTDRAPVERINDSTSTEITPASSSADRPTTAENSTSINSSTDVRSSLEQGILNNFADLFTQISSTLRYTTDMYSTLRSSILDTAQTYKKLLGAVEQFNSTQNSADNKSFSINSKPEVRKSPKRRHTEVTASTSSITQDQHSNDDANEPPKKKYNSWRFVLPPEYDPHDTKWTLKYRTNLPGLIELRPQRGVWVSYGDLKYCQQVSKDCKSLARRLLLAVFNRKALSVCLSITERAQASDNVGSNARPELDDHACTVLLNFVLEHGLQRGWNTDIQPILNTLHSKIQEIRFKYGVVVQCHLL